MLISGDRGSQLRTAINNPSVVELLIQLLPEKPGWNKRALSQAGSTSEVLFTGKLSVSGLSFHVAKSLLKYHLSDTAKIRSLLIWSPMTPHHTFTEKRCW
jgi:hypothetical protein